MKFLKGLLFVIIALAIALVTLYFIGPKNYKVERSKGINAPANIVWKQVSDFKNWNSWSPWQQKDPKVQNSYEGEMGNVGATMSWVGDPDLSGTGKMVITKITPNQSLNYNLSFEIPFEMKSTGGFTLKEKEGKTIITWYDQGNIEGLNRIFMNFFNLDAQIGPDFEKGLSNIDSICAIEVENLNKVPVAKITEVTFPKTTYLAIRKKTTLQEAMQSEFYADGFQSLGVYLGKNNLKMSGMPSSLCYEWNEVDSTCDIALSFPVAELENITEEGYEKIEVPESKAILLKHYGPYETSNETHIKLETYFKENNLTPGLVIEEYANDPESVISPNDILTNIYYFIKE